MDGRCALRQRRRFRRVLPAWSRPAPEGGEWTKTAPPGTPGADAGGLLPSPPLLGPDSPPAEAPPPLPSEAFFLSRQPPAGPEQLAWSVSSVLCGFGWFPWRAWLELISCISELWPRPCRDHNSFLAQATAPFANISGCSRLHASSDRELTTPRAIRGAGFLLWS